MKNTQTVLSFTLQNLFYTEIDNKGYFALQVIAPTLLELRTKYGLSEQLNFKDHNVPFHITIAVLKS